MGSYDDAISPPGWWYELLETALVDLTQAGDSKINLKQVAKMANDVDGRADRWDGPNITKLRNRQHATIQLVTAISKALGIVPPVFVPTSQTEAVAMERWLLAYRQTSTIRSGATARRADNVQALDSVIEVARDQTNTVRLDSEGSPRDPRTRRAPRGR